MSHSRPCTTTCTPSSNREHSLRIGRESDYDFNFEQDKKMIELRKHLFGIRKMNNAVAQIEMENMRYAIKDGSHSPLGIMKQRRSRKASTLALPVSVPEQPKPSEKGLHHNLGKRTNGAG